MLHAPNCVRYSLDPGRQLAPEEVAAGLGPPSPLRINFYDDVAVGHSIVGKTFTVRVR